MFTVMSIITITISNIPIVTLISICLLLFLLIITFIPNTTCVQAIQGFILDDQNLARMFSSPFLPQQDIHITPIEPQYNPNMTPI